MIKIFFTLVLLCLLNWSAAQYLHTPKDIQALMEASTNQYAIDTVSLPHTTEKYLNLNSFAEILTLSSTIETSEKGEKYRLRGNKNLKKGKYNKAIKSFKKALASKPQDKSLLNALAQAQRGKGDFQASIQSLLKITAENRADYETHLALADNYEALTAKTEALYHISMAHLLNRNDPAILARLKNIYEKFDLHYGDWSFSPQYEISKSEEGIRISYASVPARTYGACKAVWLFEEGYREKMEELSNDPSSIIEEKECLLNALIGYEQMPVDRMVIPALELLREIITQEKVNDFIYYEIITRKHPKLFASLSSDKQNQLINYLLVTRNGLQQKMP
ncbi:MAG: tetratricopeptide repeat protein [Saprospiraceae bacterium]